MLVRGLRDIGFSELSLSEESIIQSVAHQPIYEGPSRVRPHPGSGEWAFHPDDVFSPEKV